MTLNQHELLPYPRGVVRAVFRAPILLYRMGMGNLVDLFHIFILTTRGRRSGQPRFTPVEYRRHGSKYYVISAWGSRPNWYHNLNDDPIVTIRQGGRVFQARASLVENQSEALLVLHLFRRPNPLLYDIILARVGNIQAVDPRTLPDLAGQYTIVRFDPQPDHPALPAPPSDLRWMPWMGAFLGAALTLALVFGRSRSSEQE
jgi:deazaflavin-dependent oxidoreductase (nitroreductase family)